MLTANEIGERIAVARKLKNLSQAQLSDYLAVSAQAVGKWERGESMPDIITFQRLAELLGVDLNYFAGDGTLSSEFDPLSEYAETDSGETDEKPKWNMSGGSWANADFSGLFGLAERFSGANIDKCRFVGSELSGLVLKSNNITRSDFTGSDLSGCHFTYAHLDTNTFAGCDFSNSRFLKSNVTGCDFSKANLTNATYKWGNFKKNTFDDAVLYRTKFEFGQLTEITFTGRLTECTFENCDFARVTFSSAVLNRCFFKNAKLRRATFVNCRADRLTYAFIQNCGANMSGVTMVEDEPQ